MLGQRAPGRVRGRMGDDGGTSPPRGTVHGRRAVARHRIVPGPRGAAPLSRRGTLVWLVYAAGGVADPGDGTSYGQALA